MLIVTHDHIEMIKLLMDQLDHLLNDPQIHVDQKSNRL